MQTYLDTPDIRPHDLTVCVNIEWLVGGYDQPSFPEELNTGDIMVFPVHDPGHKSEYLEYVLFVDRTYVEESIVDSRIRGEIEPASGTFPVPNGNEQTPDLVRRSVELDLEFRRSVFSESLEHGKHIQGRS